MLVHIAIDAFRKRDHRQLDKVLRSQLLSQMHRSLCSPLHTATSGRASWCHEVLPAAEEKLPAAHGMQTVPDVSKKFWNVEK